MAKKARKKDKKASARQTKANAPTPFDLLHLTVEFLKARIATLEAKITALEKVVAESRPHSWDKRRQSDWPVLPPLPTWNGPWRVDCAVNANPPVNTTETPTAYSPTTVTTTTDAFTWYKPAEVVGPGRNTLK
jgi:hypothetical protein